MISSLDPTKVDWNNPSVVYLIKYFETATKARDEEIDQLKKQIAQLREENDQSEKQIAQLREENDQSEKQIAQLREENDQSEKQIAQLREENDQSEKQIAQLREENDQLKRRIKGGNASNGAAGSKRSYNVRNFKGYPRTAKSSKKLKTDHRTKDLSLR